MINLKYYKQETNYTCGAAAMRMALEFFGIKKTEKRIAKLLSTNKIVGTRPKYFSAVAEKFKLNYTSMRNANIRDLKTYWKKKYVVIVCYYYEEENLYHYAIIKRVGNQHVYFWDPAFGDGHRYTLEHFKEVRRNGPRFNNEKQRFFAVKASEKIIDHKDKDHLRVKQSKKKKK